MSRVATMETLVADAAALGASDVHLDLDGEHIRVRMRIGGRLRTWDAADDPASGLRSSAWQIVDTGARTLSDWQVATHADGERLSLRLRAQVLSGLEADLRGLGMSSVQARSVARAGERPGGIVVVAGAPGSGRRTTIDAMLRDETRSGGSIVSVGVPISDALIVAPGSADAVPAAIDRALTLDPDTLVLDDVIDPRSATRAFQLAAAGRRVIVRLTADDAIAAVTRLLALKVDRFTLAANLRAVVAQRLTTRLCPTCRRPVQASNRIAALLGFDPGAVVYESPGCLTCENSGAGGRIGVFEVIECDDGIARLLNGGADAALLSRHAFVSAPRLDSAARAMVRDGVISGEEALRLSRPGSAVLSSMETAR